jgi:hypothetical protein
MKDQVGTLPLERQAQSPMERRTRGPPAMDLSRTSRGSSRRCRGWGRLTCSHRWGEPDSFPSLAE